VVILDYNGVEGVKRCHDHPKAMERIIFHDWVMSDACHIGFM
jgi:hypothetical protein